MHFYFSLYVISILLLSFSEKYKKAIPYALCLIGIMIVFVVGFRGYSVGVDTQSYVGIFQEITGGIEGRFVQERVNKIYYYLNKIVGYFTESPTPVFVIAAAIFTFCILSTAYKYSYNLILSFLTFMGLGLFFYMHNVLRESLAVAVMFFGIRYFLDRKYLKSIAVCLVAFGFHNSFFGFIPLLLIAMLPIGALTYLLVWVLAFINFFSPMGKDLIVKIIQYTPFDKYVHYLDSSALEAHLDRLTVGLGFASYHLVFLFLLFAYHKRQVSLSFQEAFFIRISMLTLIFSTMFFQFGYLTRISNYGNPYFLLSIPIAISVLFRGYSKLIVTILFSLYMIALFVWGVIKGASGITPYTNILFG